MPVCHSERQTGMHFLFRNKANEKAGKSKPISICVAWCVGRVFDSDRRRQRASYCMYESDGSGWDGSSMNTDNSKRSMMSLGQEIIRETENASGNG